MNVWQREVDEQWEGGIIKGQQEIIMGDEYVHYLHCGGFMGICQNFSNMCSF